MSELWVAPQADGPVTAVVPVPGSKSITNRAVLLAALADGPSTISAPLRSRDSALMLAGLRALGTGIDEVPGAAGEIDWRVTPQTLRGPADVDCGLAGTVMRFLPPVAALVDGPVYFDGDPRARQRPMGPVLRALRDLGAELDSTTGLPFTLIGHGGLPGGRVQLDASASSQFVSGLLLAAARYDKGVDVVHVGPPVPSLPHIRMTIAMLRAAQVEVDDRTSARWHLTPGPIAARDLRIEPDLSNAAPYLAAALLTAGSVTVAGLAGHSVQPVEQVCALLTRMGAVCTPTPDGLQVQGSGRVIGLDADLGEVGELAPTIAAVAALAESPSMLRGIGHLRGHETDRLAALATEINALGGDVRQTDDGLVIRPRPLRSVGVFHTYDDHRMATTGALLGLLVRGVEVENVATTAKTLPDFVGSWLRMLDRDIQGRAD